MDKSCRDTQKRGVVGWPLVVGALEEDAYYAKLAGFEQITIDPTHVYHAEDAREFLAGAGRDANTSPKKMESHERILSAVKPSHAGEKSCCGPTCCI